MQGQQKWCEGQKETSSDAVEHAQRARALPTCTQPIQGGGPRVKVFRGCGLAVGRNGGSMMGFPLKLL